MKLSRRLQLLADVIDTYKQGTTLADIGTDHAYLPCYLVENDIVCHVYACDVAKGPFQSSVDTIAQYNLEQRVTPLLGDGLYPILDKEVDMITISGMGSYLITDILNANKEYLDNVNVLFLQPNANIDHLRSYLFSHYWQIVDEQMIKDAGHIYEVLVVTKRSKKDVIYTDKDIEFGPILGDKQPPLFKEKWEKQYHEYHRIMESLSKDHPRYIELDLKIKMIEDVLHEN